jgi:hypothetical protein
MSSLSSSIGIREDPVLAAVFFPTSEMARSQSSASLSYFLHLNRIVAAKPPNLLD